MTKERKRNLLGKESHLLTFLFSFLFHSLDFFFLIKILDASTSIDTSMTRTEHKLLAEFRPKLESHIVASAVSDNGQWIAVSDTCQTKVFKCLQQEV